MVSPVITVKPSCSIPELAKTLLEHRISGVPVVDDSGRLVGIVSEGDLLHRAETKTQRQRSWWLLGFIKDETLASEYIKAHSRKVTDIMTRPVITAAPDVPLHEIASLLESNSIKRVPIMHDGQLVGIVTRSNLIQALASAGKELDIPLSDSSIREKILAKLKQQPWAHTALLNVTVNAGVVDLWGVTRSDTERKAIRVAAETTPGVCAVNDNLMRSERTSAWA
jgi:CBS domain-containing protein